MSHCPSHDWDRHVDAMDEEQLAEARWWARNGDRVLQVVCAAVRNGSDNWKASPSLVVEQAAALVRQITDRAIDPYTGEPFEEKES